MLTTRVQLLCVHCAATNGLLANLVQDEVVLDVTTDRDITVVARVQIVDACACEHSRTIASDHPRLLDAVRDWLEARARRHQTAAAILTRPIGYAHAS